MTSKDVDKLIRSELWPFVREPVCGQRPHGSWLVQWVYAYRSSQWPPTSNAAAVSGAGGWYRQIPVSVAALRW